MEYIDTLISLPFLALLPVALYAWAFKRFNSKSSIVACLAWFAYFIYETFLIGDGYDIRVDLLLIYPLLLALSLAPIYFSFKTKKKD